MPKIILDNTKKCNSTSSQKLIVYAVKTCDSCGSIMEIYESEITSVEQDEHRFIHFKCPCGKDILLRKYFGARMYSQNDYLKCVGFFQDRVYNVLWKDLRNVPYGYFTEYINLHHTTLVVSPIKVSIDIYINEYDKDWNKCIKSNVYYKSFPFNMCLLSTDLNECAKYAQALIEFILYSAKKVGLQFPGDIDLKIDVDKTDLIAYFRNGDMSITQEDINTAMYERITNQ